MTLWDYLSTDENKDVPSEVILNILREIEDPVMGTQEIADRIDMSRQGAQNRLEDLEEENKVAKRKIGDTLVWGLHPGERQQPIAPEIDRMVRVFDRFRAFMQPTKFFGGLVLAIGFAMLYMGVTGVLVDLSNPVIGNDLLTISGWAGVVIGALTWLVGFGVIYGTVVAERVALWRVRKNKVPNQSTENRSDSRGQVSPRLVVGVFVLLVAAGPLIKAGIQIQTDLASSTTFSPVQALVIATSLIGIIVASILGTGKG